MYRFLRTVIAIQAVTGMLAAHVWAEDECGSTVDMAESGNLEQLHNCDGSDSGINKAFRRLFSSRDETPAQEVSVTEADSSLDIATNSEQGSAQASFSSAHTLADVRYRMLLTLAEDCNNHFRVLSEDYSFADGEGLLQLIYQCK